MRYLRFLNKRRGWLVLAICSLVFSALGAGNAAAQATQAVGTPVIQNIHATFYGGPDNSPPGAAIAYPKWHRQAGGTGTFKDPITVAVPDGLFSPGTLLYVPYLKKYIGVEDQCYDPYCNGDQAHHRPHVDIWIGGVGADKSVTNTCEGNLDAGYPVPMVVNPPDHMAVDTNPLFSNGTCIVDSQQSPPKTLPDLQTQIDAASGGNGGGSQPGTPGTRRTGPGTPPPPANSPCAPPSTKPVVSGNFDTPNWQQSWGIQAGASTTIGLDNLTPVSDPNGVFPKKTLQVAYPATTSPQTVAEYPDARYGGQFLSPFPATFVCQYLSYYVMFPKGFDFTSGGFLPGIYGGSTVVGSQPPDGTNGFSVRLMWDQTGGGGINAYLPYGSALVAPNYSFDGHNTSIGQDRWQFAADGHWHHLVMQVVLNNNTVGELANGTIRVWYDEQHVLSVTGVEFRQPGNVQLHIDGLFFSTFLLHQPSQSSSTALTSPRVSFADFAASSAWMPGTVQVPPQPPQPPQPPVAPGGGSYDLALKIVPQPGAVAGTQTYQLQVSNLSGTVTQPIILDLVVLGNTHPLQITTTASDQGWVIVRNSNDSAPRIEGNYTGTQPGYPIPAGTALPPITVTVSGAIDAGASLFAWVDVSGTSGDENFANNVASQVLGVNS